MSMYSGLPNPALIAEPRRQRTRSREWKLFEWYYMCMHQTTRSGPTYMHTMDREGETFVKFVVHVLVLVALVITQQQT